MRFGYLVVEGPHDVAFIGRLLRPLGFSLIRHLSRLDSYLQPLVPRGFPPSDGDLLRRMQVPTFFASSTHVVVVRSADGDSKIAKALEAPLALDNWTARFTGIGVLVDADDATALERSARLLLHLRDSFSKTWDPAWFGKPGESSSPRWGLHILPNNQDSGTLEDLLLEAAHENYPELLDAARNFIATVKQSPVRDALTEDDAQEFRAPAGEKKATVATMASVLKPGKAIQVSLQDNRWLEGTALTRPRIAAVQEFLARLLSLPNV